MTTGKHVRSEFISMDQKPKMVEMSPYFDLIRTYHPDEQYIIKILANMAKNKEFQPSSFIYGPFFFYQMGAGVFAAKVAGVLPPQTDVVYFMKNPSEFASVYLGARTLIAVMGVLSVIITFLIGLELSGIKLGFIAALMLSSIPLFNLAGKFIKPDMPCLLWSSCALLFSIYIYKHGRLRDYLIAGICVAFAAGSKYPGVLSCFYIAAYFFARNYDFAKKSKDNFRNIIKGKEFKYLIGSGLACIVAFIITNPSCVLKYSLFSSDVNWIASVLRKGNFFANLFDFIICFFYDGFFFNIGSTMLIFLIVGLILNIVKPSKLYWPMLTVIALFVIMASRGRPGSEAYLLPLLAPVSLISAHLIENIKSKTIMYSIVFIVVIPSFALTIAYNIIAAGENSRLTATKWINQNVPAGSSISRKQYPVSYRTAMTNPDLYPHYNSMLQAKKAKLANYFIDCSFDWEGPSWKKRFNKNYNPSHPPTNDFVEIKKIENIPMLFGFIPVKRNYMLGSYLETVSPQIIIYKRKEKTE